MLRSISPARYAAYVILSERRPLSRFRLSGNLSAMPALARYDLFLSHATPNKVWVRQLAAQLEALGLRVFLDEAEIRPGDNWVDRLSQGLEASRYLVLVLSPHSVDRAWVVQEWTSYVARYGPRHRLIPVMLENVEVPTILAATQYLLATDGNAATAAQQIYRVVGDHGALAGPERIAVFSGRHLSFTLSRGADNRLRIIDPAGVAAEADSPWRSDPVFNLALLEYRRLTRTACDTDAMRIELSRHATTIGEQLFGLLFRDISANDRAAAFRPGGPAPVLTIRSDDDDILAQPWELLHSQGVFLVRDHRMHVVRTTLGEVDPVGLLREPTLPLKLVVNVSAPEGSLLSYEDESYQITRALAGRCVSVSTELGTLDDFAQVVQGEKPTAVLFSGHGAPGALVFEDDEGQADAVQIAALLTRLRRGRDGPLPKLFYLASCHGNDPVIADGAGALASAAAMLHREGMTEVVAYSGPISDTLSTWAESALFWAIADGQTTRQAVDHARAALMRPLDVTHDKHRPEPTALRDGNAIGGHAYPFAWAQMVFYRRGPEFPLSVPRDARAVELDAPPQRSFAGTDRRRVLQTGFIGRRIDLHRTRRRIRRDGQRVLVFQGLGGLGKSTLAARVLPLLGTSRDTCTLWCQEVAEAADPAGALVDQLLAYCRVRFGREWERVVQTADRQAGADPASRFGFFLHQLIAKSEHTALYMDNLESLLESPHADGPAAFGEWRSPALRTIWQVLDESARNSDRLYVVASSRYRHEDFGAALVPVGPLPSDAVYRLMSWFPALRRLSHASKVKLVAKLEGHPRAVEFADALVAERLAEQEGRYGQWIPPTNDSEEAAEWCNLVDSVLPQVHGRIQDDLLMKQIWDRVLDERARRMLLRAALMRRPFAHELLASLGEEGESVDATVQIAQRLLSCSLLEQWDLTVQLGHGPRTVVRRYAMHPATRRFALNASGEHYALRMQTHERVGSFLEALARTAKSVEPMLEGAHHLFQAEQFDRAFALTSICAEAYIGWGRTREVDQLLNPFLSGSVRARLAPASLGRLLGTVAMVRFGLGEMPTAIDYFQQTLPLFRRAGDRRGEGSTLGHLGNAYLRLSRVPQAIEAFKQALSIARETGDRKNEPTRLGNLGRAYAEQEQLPEAMRCYEESLALCRSMGDRRGEGGMLANLASAYARLERVQEAVTFLEQAYVIAHETFNLNGERVILGNWAHLLIDLGQPRKAIECYEQSLSIARDIGDPFDEVATLCGLGMAYLESGAAQKAVECFDQALVMSRDSGDRHGEMESLASSSLVLIRKRDGAKAIEYASQALAIAREIGDRRGESVALVNLGAAWAIQGDVALARGALEHAGRINEQVKDPRIARKVAANLAKLPKT
jgi:tetratricopeptide (TPR) repeat protein